MNRILHVLFVLSIADGCGGGSSSSVSMQPPPPSPQSSTVRLNANVSASPGFQSLTTTVQAQTMPTIVISGTYYGYCPAAYVGTQPTAIVFFGAGSLAFNGFPQNSIGSQNCTDGGNTGGTGVTPGQGAASSAGALGDVAPVIGNGTLSGLVVTDSIKSVAAGSQSGLTEVWVIRSGQTMPAGISCTLGASNRCEDAVHTFSLQDGDGLVVTLTSEPGDALQIVQFFLGKQ